MAKGNPPVHLCTSQQNMLSSFTALCLFQTGKKSAKVTVHENECYLYLARLQISTWVGNSLGRQQKIGLRIKNSSMIYEQNILLTR